MKSHLKNSARVLRRRGYSFSQISERFGISKSTASLWTRDVELSPFGVDRLQGNRKSANLKSISTRRRQKLQKLEIAEREAQDHFDNLNFENIQTLIPLSIMYLCEGAKDQSHVAFTNSDPELVASFINMLLIVFSIDRGKIRICVHLHDYHDEGEILEFWSSTLNIPLAQFTEPYHKKSSHIFKKEGYKGCVRVTYFDAHIAKVLILFAKKIVKHYI